MKYRIVALLLTVFSGFGVTCAQEQVTLEQVIALALEKNFDVQVARENARSVATTEKYVEGAFLPQIVATGATVWNDNDQTLRFQDETRNNSGEARSNNLTGSVGLTWTLFYGTRMFATRASLRIVTSAKLRMFSR